MDLLCLDSDENLFKNMLKHMSITVCLGNSAVCNWDSFLQTEFIKKEEESEQCQLSNTQPGLVAEIHVHSTDYRRLSVFVCFRLEKVL